MTLIRLTIDVSTIVKNKSICFISKKSYKIEKSEENDHKYLDIQIYIWSKLVSR